LKRKVPGACLVSEGEATGEVGAELEHARSLWEYGRGVPAPRKEAWDLMTTGAGFVRETVTATREVRYWRHSNHPLSFHYTAVHSSVTTSTFFSSFFYFTKNLQK